MEPPGTTGKEEKLQPPPTPPGSLSDQLRVVVVDDSSLIRQRILSLLGPLRGVSVVGQATTPAEGFSLVQSLAPDVVTLDINLEGGNGLDLLKEIKALPLPPMVIVLTNYPYPAFRSRSRELGAEHFLTKAREFHQIQGILETCLSDLGPSPLGGPR